MEQISKKQYDEILKMIGVSYLGGTKHSAKMMYSFNKGTLTYCLYLAPATMANIIRNGKVVSVCPNSKWCKDACLNGSGHNKADQLVNGVGHSRIDQARIKKTKFAFDSRELFTKALCYEIEKAKQKAKKLGMEFSIRLNGTSDLDFRAFKVDGKNIFEIFNEVQFYDYTKVYNHTKFNIANYDLTLSYNGYNWKSCEEYLRNGGKVAVVFDTDNLPQEWRGYKVIDANGYDMRYIDPLSTIMGLHYHRVASDYHNGQYVRPNTKFVVGLDD